MSAHARPAARPKASSADRVVMLLSLVGYLRERDAVPVAELAERFATTPEEVRELIGFLGTAGVPGDTQRYQHEDLFDIDWDALELRDEARLTQMIAVDAAPRFAPAETAALLAGLHAFTPLLPAADAVRAEALANKLANALGGPTPALSLEQDAADSRVAVLVDALRDGREARFGYRDAAGVATERRVRPLGLTQDGDAWYLRAHCFDRQAERSFRVAQITELRLGAMNAAESTAEATAEAPTDVRAPQPGGYSELIATVPATSLPALAGFAPRVLEESSPGYLRVAIDAWHGALALQLMRVAPGRIVIESPPQARADVYDWASRALAAYDA
ncbi:helix-turn-helix transcriptional regulator [Leucobacter salsicius]|uniref:helix-turn-helix transcriptional regulator n=1 Tax=Leucobacter salsicius TaxID=664638 RepID=UPI00034B31A2|nr:WYL domain-containing protein [Leucobacter salsicius]